MAQALGWLGTLLVTRPKKEWTVRRCGGQVPGAATGHRVSQSSESILATLLCCYYAAHANVPGDKVAENERRQSILQAAL